MTHPATPDDALAALKEAQREVLMAEARIASARREVSAALDAQREARTAQRYKVLAAREAGATHAQVAAVLQVSVQRAHAIAGKDPEVKRR